ncbi:MAG: nucleotide sugar dehydrogenase [Candidatus Desulfofervidus sp.]|nr:nucleotide sugar dehydrogenase [Candidatus Desulfofervidus sp.]
MRYQNELLARFKAHDAQIAIVGLGYVGLPLAVEFAKSGFFTWGIDVDRDKIEAASQGISYILDVKTEELRPLVRQKRLRLGSEYEVLERCQAVIICVPTPLRKTKDPDLSYVLSAVKEVSKHLSPPKLVILESTTYPGTTEEMVKPALEVNGLKVGKEIFLAFSPERVDPGNPKYNTRNIPKVIGGVTPACTQLAKTLYSQVLERVIPASSATVAEMVKLLENTFRSVNIALVNEMAVMCNKLGVNVWEVIDAAATKPFGFMPFYPGPGIGGHCIPIDPIYLTWKARMVGFEARLIELASQINSQMPHFVVEKVVDALNGQEKSVKNSKLHILGVAYKPNVSDIRESPALDIITLLHRKGAKITYSDPHVPQLRLGGLSLKAKPLNGNALKTADCVVLVTNHDAFDYEYIWKNARLIVDTRNAFKNFDKKVIRL